MLRLPLNPQRREPDMNTPVRGAVEITRGADRFAVTAMVPESTLVAVIDGAVITGNELATVQREWGELVAQGAALVSLLQAKHLAGRPGGAA